MGEAGRRGHDRWDSRTPAQEPHELRAVSPALLSGAGDPSAHGKMALSSPVGLQRESEQLASWEANRICLVLSFPWDGA